MIPSVCIIADGKQYKISTNHAFPCYRCGKILNALAIVVQVKASKKASKSSNALQAHTFGCPGT